MVAAADRECRQERSDVGRLDDRKRQRMNVPVWEHRPQYDMDEKGEDGL